MGEVEQKDAKVAKGPNYKAEIRILRLSFATFASFCSILVGGTGMLGMLGMLKVFAEVGIDGEEYPAGREDEETEEHEECDGPEETEDAQDGRAHGPGDLPFVKLAETRPEEAQDQREEVTRIPPHIRAVPAVAFDPIAAVACAGIVERGAA